MAVQWQWKEKCGKIAVENLFNYMEIFEED